MNTQMKQWCVIGGCVVVVFGLIAVVGKMIGHGEIFGVAVLSGVAMGLSTALAWAMEKGGNDSLRGAFYATGPMGVTMLVVVGYIYPGELTPTFLAEEIAPGALAARLDDYAGRKVVVRGVVSLGGESTGWLADGEGSVEIAWRGAGHEPIALPDSGTEVVAVGVVRGDSYGLQLIAKEVRVVSAGEVVAGVQE